MYRHDEEEYRRWHSYGQRRGWFDRARDQVESWFGDEDAEARRDMDRMRNLGRRDRERGYVGNYGDEGAQRFHDDSRYSYSRESNRPYGYMYGSQSFERSGPVERWRLGGTEFGEYGTRPIDEMQRGNHYGRGPRNYQRNDERIREDVVERLVRHHDIDATDVEVSVTGGEVILKGMVESRSERRLAEDIAEDVFGVKNVQNLIKVRQMIGIDRPNPSPGEEMNPRTTGGIMGTTPGGNNK
jgi:osmotically-inducible protein OsmY